VSERHVADAAIALATGYGIYWVAAGVSDVAVDVLAQHVIEFVRFRTVEEVSQNIYGPVPERLHFTVGGTAFFYGDLLTRTLALVLVGLVALTAWRRRERRLAECAHCLSRIPRAATVCRECSLEAAR
jgi:hypothetical protein